MTRGSGDAATQSPPHRVMRRRSDGVTVPLRDPVIGSHRDAAMARPDHAVIRRFSDAATVQHRDAIAVQRGRGVIR
ncbi:hypothetical protein [Mycobacterium sp.]|uniref:hypothetical protein n=1 Tax=Mycobacterium sp. TaxID=1785 RepID=UPI003BAF4269